MPEKSVGEEEGIVELPSSNDIFQMMLEEELRKEEERMRNKTSKTPKKGNVISAEDRPLKLPQKASLPQLSDDVSSTSILTTPPSSDSVQLTNGTIITPQNIIDFLPKPTHPPITSTKTEQETDKENVTNSTNEKNSSHKPSISSGTPRVVDKRRSLCVLL